MKYPLGNVYDGQYRICVRKQAPNSWYVFVWDEDVPEEGGHCRYVEKGLPTSRAAVQAARKWLGKQACVAAWRQRSHFRRNTWRLSKFLKGV